jgi:hypothetical protein
VDDPSERAGEPTHVLVERNVFAADRRAGNRDGAKGGGGAGPARLLTGLVRRVRQCAAPVIDGRRGGCPILQGRRWLR